MSLAPTEAETYGYYNNAKIKKLNCQKVSHTLAFGANVRNALATLR